ncbi:hypothetical protein RRG08_031288 [Elysia crispata]|uniref:Uncharacterized protein n=1 Tax=Elysia crispata TaxID=231223 RepID=A0AAE1AJ53_9GAST|nr:hypothetical protein RRG08_031288 [Elysia crispata]
MSFQTHVKRIKSLEAACVENAGVSRSINPTPPAYTLTLARVALEKNLEAQRFIGRGPLGGFSHCLSGVLWSNPRALSARQGFEEDQQLFRPGSCLSLITHDHRMTSQPGENCIEKKM